MKGFIAAALLSLTQQLKWDQLKVNPSARGEHNPDEHYWTGHLYECDQQCTDNGGMVCGQNQRQCCEQEQCETKFGMEVCTSLLTFTCEPLESSSYKLKPTLTPEGFP